MSDIDKQKDLERLIAAANITIEQLLDNGLEFKVEGQNLIERRDSQQQEIERLTNNVSDVYKLLEESREIRRQLQQDNQRLRNEIRESNRDADAHVGKLLADNQRLRGALENIIDTNDPVQMVTLARETLEATDD
ncbi:MAG: hypothetical protein ACYSUK_00200 [Planctomycetota bacterium]|jgi:hypothetical protein